MRRLLLLLALLLLAAAPAHAWNPDPQVGAVVLDALSYSSRFSQCVSDGSGGAYVVWTDQRVGTDHVYVQHVSASGVPLWTANGVQVATQTTQQSYPSLTPDNSGGVWVTWSDTRTYATTGFDIYLQHFNSAGTALLAANGLAVVTLAANQFVSIAVPDGSGGVILGWQDARATPTGVYVQRYNSAGTALWTANGVLCTSGVGGFYGMSIAPDNAGGVWATFGALLSNAYATVYTQHVNAGGARQYAAGGIAISVTGADQEFPQTISDGAGGIYAAWTDFRTVGETDLAYGRVTQAGGVTFSGLLRSGPEFWVDDAVLASDGSQGLWAAWSESHALNDQNNDIYVQHLLPSGSMAFAANGVLLCSATNGQDIAAIVGDGEGGAIVSWQDFRSNGPHGAGYAQRMNANGTAQWTNNGLLFTGTMQFANETGLATDGKGGAIAVLSAYGNDGISHASVQRIDHFGVLGDPSPAITRVKDVPFDQGGKMALSWTASYLDPEPYLNISDYAVYRSVPGAIAQAWLASGAAVSDEASSTSEALTVRVLGRHVVTAPDAATGYAWEFLGTTNATHDPAAGAAYSYIVPTLGDSIGAGNPYTKVRVQARVSTVRFWYSNPDSGYSVDNIPPVTPAPFTAQFANGVTRLHWNPNTDADLAGYRVYRGLTAGFTPSPANLIAAPSDTGLTDVSAQTYVYKLTAVDSHGNESPVATVIPTGVLDAPAAHAVALFLAAPQPNPVRAQAVLRFGLPAAAHVRLTLLDVAGRTVRTLAAGARDAGEQAVTFDGRDDAGRALAPGLYLARLECAGRALTQRMLVIP